MPDRDAPFQRNAEEEEIKRIEKATEEKERERLQRQRLAKEEEIQRIEEETKKKK
jgi:hypothetical protein